MRWHRVEVQKAFNEQELYVDCIWQQDFATTPRWPHPHCNTNCPCNYITYIKNFPPDKSPKSQQHVMIRQRCVLCHCVWAVECGEEGARADFGSFTLNCRACTGLISVLISTCQCHPCILSHLINTLGGVIATINPRFLIKGSVCIEVWLARPCMTVSVCVSVCLKS